MAKRLTMKEAAPDSYRAMAGLERFVSQSGVNPLHLEMIKNRASIINGCAYCIDMHTRKARSLGETEQRIYALAAWRESPLFTDEERAMLALTDEITRIGRHGVSDEVYVNITKYFNEQLIAGIIMAIVTINAWNRIMVATQMVFEE